MAADVNVIELYAPGQRLEQPLDLHRTSSLTGARRSYVFGFELFFFLFFNTVAACVERALSQSHAFFVSFELPPSLYFEHKVHFRNKGIHETYSCICKSTKTVDGTMDVPHCNIAVGCCLKSSNGRRAAAHVEYYAAMRSVLSKIYEPTKQCV